jgi:hypothetical protein
MKKIMITVLLSTVVLTGCMGQGGLVGNVAKFNLEATDHRWGREGLFLGLIIIPVYPISVTLDLLIFNSVEFWSGTNPITGKSPALVDQQVAMLKNHGINGVEYVSFDYSDDKRTVTMYVEPTHGKREIFKAALGADDVYRFYRDDQLIAEIPKDQLQQFHASLESMTVYASAEIVPIQG